MVTHTSIIDGCNLSSLTRPFAKALAADARSNQWLRSFCMREGSIAYGSHQSRYSGPKKAPNMSSTLSLRK